MDLDMLITEADPARRVRLPEADSAAGLRLYRDIMARPPARKPIRQRLHVWRSAAPRLSARRMPGQLPARMRRLGMPAAAALAVVAVVTGVSLAGHAARPAQNPGDQPAGLLLSAAVVSSPPARIAETGMPRFYVILDHARLVAYVRQSETGRVTSTVPLPGWTDPKLGYVTAAGNGRTFALALGSAQTRFYLIRIGPDGRSARLTSLAVPRLPAGYGVGSLALSADGRRLAVAAERFSFSPSSPGDPGVSVQLQVISLATGAVRSWSTAWPGTPTNLSWAKGGRELSFFWQDMGTTAGSSRTSKSGLWLLDTTAQGRSLLSGPRILPAAIGNDSVQEAVLTPDGSTMIASVTYDGVAQLARGTVVGGIVELSARTGRPLRTLLAERAPYSADPGHAGHYTVPCGLGAVDTSGQHLLVSCDSFGRLDNGRFTALPGVAAQSKLAVGW